MEPQLWRQERQSAADRWRNGPDRITVQQWARKVDDAAARWAWEQSAPWRSQYRDAWLRAWRRHPWRSARAALRWRQLKRQSHGR